MRRRQWHIPDGRTVGSFLSVVALCFCCLVFAADRRCVTVTDHGLRPAVFPRYLGKGPGLGWQDLHNQDDSGRYWVRREFEFANARVPWRLFQLFTGSPDHPIGLLGLRFAQSAHRVTATQPRWLGTWGARDEQYPGLLDVRVGDEHLAGVPVDFERGQVGAAGFVVCRWRPPFGSVEATFMMLPDDERLFLQVWLQPRESVDQLSISLYCWPLGDFAAVTEGAEPVPLSYGKAYTLPETRSSLLLADPQFDPAGREDHGVCGLTYIPLQTTSCQLTRTFPLELRFRVAPGTDSEYRLHFALWELLHRRGDDAWQYLLSRETDTVERLSRLDACLSAAHTQDLGRAQRRLDRLSARIDGATAPSATPELTGGYWRCHGAARAWSWAQFFHAEAVYALGMRNWMTSDACVDRAEKALSGATSAEQGDSR